MPRELSNSVVVITGASSGIGRAAALAFAREGARVVLAARREQPLTEAAAECEAQGAQSLAVPTDVVGNAGRLLALQRTFSLGLYERLSARVIDRDHFQDRAASPGARNLFDPMPEGTGVSGGWKSDVRSPLAVPPSCGRPWRTRRSWAGGGSGAARDRGTLPGRRRRQVDR